MGYPLIYDLKLQFIFGNFSVYSFEHSILFYFFLLHSIKLNKNNNNKNYHL